MMLLMLLLLLLLKLLKLPMLQLLMLALHGIGLLRNLAFEGFVLPLHLKHVRIHAKIISSRNTLQPHN